MNKIIYVALVVLLPSAVFSQVLSTSPYSAFGLGQQKYMGNVESVSMGSLNAVYWDNVHTNPKNPATYSFLSLTNFTIGGIGELTQYETESDSQNNNYFGVDQLVLGIPMGKFGAAFGFMPTSTTGYNINASEILVDPQLAINNVPNPYDGTYQNVHRFTGYGGINKFFVGLSFSPFKGFSIGANANYNFGNLSRTARVVTPAVYHQLDNAEDAEPVVVFEGAQYGTYEEEALRLRNWDFDLGLLYTGNVGDNFQYTIGATYGFGNDTSLEYDRNLYTISFDSQGRQVPMDTLSVESGSYDKNSITLPKNGSAGLSVGNYKKWMFGVNYEFADPVDLSFGNENYSVEYKQRVKYSAGGYLIPKFNSLMSYWERITYRAGFKYEELGLNINGTDIVDYSINFGLGLPLRNGVSNVNIGGALGTRGTTENGLIKENYFMMSLSFSLSDKWFYKRKFE